MCAGRLRCSPEPPAVQQARLPAPAAAPPAASRPACPAAGSAHGQSAGQGLSKRPLTHGVMRTGLCLPELGAACTPWPAGAAHQGCLLAGGDAGQQGQEAGQLGGVDATQHAQQVADVLLGQVGQGTQQRGEGGDVHLRPASGSGGGAGSPGSARVGAPAGWDTAAAYCHACSWTRDVVLMACAWHWRGRAAHRVQQRQQRGQGQQVQLLEVGEQQGQQRLQPGSWGGGGRPGQPGLSARARHSSRRCCCAGCSCCGVGGTLAVLDCPGVGMALLMSKSAL